MQFYNMFLLMMNILEEYICDIPKPQANKNNNAYI